MSDNKDTIHLVLTVYWFDQVQHGKKFVEYRSMSAFWKKRILDRRDTLKHVVFHRGYTSRTILVDVLAIDVGGCPYPKWNQIYYRIHFLKRQTGC